MLGSVQIQEAANHIGQTAQGRSEDDGHNAAHVHFDGNIAGLTAVHFAANHALCVLHRNAAFSVGQDHYKDHSNKGQNDHGRDHNVVTGSTSLCTGEHILEGRAHAGPVSHDTGKDHQGQAVANTLCVDLIAHPCDKLSTGGEAGHDNDTGEDTGKAIGVLQRAHAADDKVVSDAQQQRDCRTGVVADLGELLTALLTLFGEILQIRDRNTEQLNNNRCVDIGLNPQRKDRAAAHGTAGHHVEVSQHAAGGEHGFQCTAGDIRYRNCAAKTEKNQDQKRVQKALTQIFGLPGVAKRFEHLRSPQPSRLLSQSFPWPKQCKLQP